MSNFEDGSYGSAKGIALIAKVLAGRCQMKYTRVAAGKGYIPEGETPKTMPEPAEYVMDAKIASISNPVDGECQVTIQINSADVDTGFYCTGLLLYAEDPDEGEIPYTYLVLENEPEWVRPKSSIVGKLATFDIIAAVGDVDTVVAAIDPEAIATVETVNHLIADHNSDPNAHGGIAGESCVLVRDIEIPKSGWKARTAGDEDAATDEYKVQIDIAIDEADETMFPTLALSLPSLLISGEAVVCPSIKAKDGFVRLWAKRTPTADMEGVIALLSAPHNGGAGAHIFRVPAQMWEETVGSDYSLQANIVVPRATVKASPMVAFDIASLAAAREAEICPTIQAFDGFVRLWAKSRPTEDLKGVLTLLFDNGVNPGNIPTASDSVLGGVKVQSGSGLTVDEEGNLSIDAATKDEVRDVYDRAGAQEE